MSRRRERFASALRTVVANLLQSELDDPRMRGLLTVTRVEVSPDLRLAKVYVSVLGNQGEQKSTLSALRHSAGHLQSLLKNHLEFRVCPVLDFRIDEKLKESLATMALLDQVSLELAEKDARTGRNPAEPDQPAEDFTETDETDEEQNRAGI